MTIKRTMTVARRQKSLVVAAAMVVGLFIAIPLTRGDAGPVYATATLDCPGTAHLGASILVSGHGFPANGDVDLTSDATLPVNPFRTSASGSFSASVVIQVTVARGTHTITATVTASGGSVVTRSCSLTIT